MPSFLKNSALMKEQERLEVLRELLYQEETFLENYTAHLACRASWLDKEKENGQDVQLLSEMLSIEEHSLSLRSMEFRRQDTIIHRNLEHLLLKKEWLEEQLLEKQKEKLSHDVTSLEKEVVSLKEAAQELRSILAAERVTFTEEVADMTEARKAFQLEKGHIRREMHAFRKQRTEHRMKRKAFRDEKEVISNEREDFRLEVLDMAMLRKAYLKEKREIEVKREAFQREEEQFNEEVADMAEARKAFQMEKKHIRLEMAAFKKDRSDHRTHKKAFNVEKDKISSEREAFRLEPSEIAMPSKTYLMEKKGIEVKREAFHNEANNLKTLNQNQNLNSATNYTTGPDSRHVLKKARTFDFESVWNCRDINDNCTCSKKKSYGQRSDGKSRIQDTPLKPY